MDRADGAGWVFEEPDGANKEEEGGGEAAWQKAAWQGLGLGKDYVKGLAGQDWVMAHMNVICFFAGKCSRRRMSNH